MRALLGTVSHFRKGVVLTLRTCGGAQLVESELVTNFAGVVDGGVHVLKVLAPKPYTLNPKP